MNTPRDRNPSKVKPIRQRRILRRVGIGLLVVLALIGLTALWALHTASGARFVLARVQAALDDKLGIGGIAGTLAGPLRVTNLRYRDADSGVDAQIAQASVDVGVLALFGGRVAIQDLRASDIHVALTSVASPAEPPSAFSLSPPIDLIVERLRIDRAAITRDGQPLQTIDHAELSGAWSGWGVVLRQLEVKAVDGQVNLSGTLANQTGYPGQADGRFNWRLGDITLSGTVNARGERGQTRLQLDLDQPSQTRINATIGQSAELPWTLAVEIPAFPAQRVFTDSMLGDLSLQLHGSGDRRHANVDGLLGIGAHSLALEPLRVALADKALNIEQLQISIPGTPGRLLVSGTLDLATNTPQADLTASWKDLQLPAEWVGQALHSHGSLALRGHADDYSAFGQLALGPQGALADIDIDIQGNTRSVELKRIQLKQANGGLQAKGTLTLQPELAWQIEANAQGLDPAAFAAQWPGAIEFALNSQGRLTDHGIEANLQMPRIGGRLRDRALGGSADLRLQPGNIVDGNLDLQLGDSRISITGNGGTQTDARLRFELAALTDWLPSARGASRGDLRISGSWPALALNGQVSAHDLSWTDLKANTLQADIRISDLGQAAGSMGIDVTGLAQGPFRFESLRVDADGNRTAHHLRVNAKGDPLGIALDLDGRFDGSQWQGNLARLDFDAKARRLPDLSLEQPAALAWDGSRLSLGETCLTGTLPVATGNNGNTPDSPESHTVDGTAAAEPTTAPTRLCVNGQTAAGGDLELGLQIAHLPLRLITRLAAADSPLRFRGELDGSAQLKRSASGPLQGNARFTSASGQVRYPEGGNTPALSYSDLLLEGSLDGASGNVKLETRFDHEGRIQGALNVTPSPAGEQVLDGNLDLALNDLAFLDLLSPEITRSQGRANAQYAIAGTLAEPRLLGSLNVEGLATEVPALGLKLYDGRFSVRAEDAQRFVLEGQLDANQGQLVVAGEGTLDGSTPLRMTLRGENVLVADIPALKVSISPDLVIEQDSNGVRASGTLGIPAANIDLAKLPGGGASSASADVVVTDDAKPSTKKSLPVSAEIRLVLGEEVKLAGYGFNGTLNGNLTIIEKPGRATSGSGTLNAGGIYKAYGQDLKIESGRILFVGAGIDNPGLDIRAVREIKAREIRAGLLVRGTAQLPVLTVFSEPAMEQSEALSYLVTGKPLSALKSGEGDMLGTAARALGTATGDLLAKSIGGRLGVDDIGVADDATLGGAAFTIGKYLSPKLYLSYGVGIFDPGEVVTLRYLMSRRWNFEAQNATTGSRAGINYRIEK